MADVASRMRRWINNPDSKHSLSARFRERRWERFLEVFPGIEKMRVLDLGGTPRHWLSAPVRPAEVVLLNLEPEQSDLAGIRMVGGDACDPPAELLLERFDLVYSNSLIEHVGGFVPRVAVADHVRSFAARHWIQTPYRYFPIEPHWLFPGLQFLPVAARVRAAEHWPLGWSRPSGRDNARNVLSVELLTRTEMRYLFPSSEIVEERALGLCKSLIAIKR
jgi:hypothetical protein